MRKRVSRCPPPAGLVATLRWAVACLCAMALTASVATAAAEEPRSAVADGLAAGPDVETKEGLTHIRFALKTPGDATVVVRDAAGGVVRRLGSAALGGQAPAPFQSDTLTQLVTWDGRDDSGRPVAAGDYRVEVALGLRPEFDRVIEWSPPAVLRRGILGLAVGGDGTLHVLQGYCWEARCGTPELLTFARDGAYRETLLPPPLRRLAQAWPDIQIAPNPFTGEVFPVSDAAAHVKRAGNMMLGIQSLQRQTMIECNGRLLIVMGHSSDIGRGAARRAVLSFGCDGCIAGAPEGQLYGPALPGFTTRSPAFYLGATKDGERVFLSGLRHDKLGLYHAVLVADWKDDEFALLFGELHEAGDGPARLNDPRGLAVDAAGRLLVCDYGNDRLLVLSPEGRLIESFPVSGPEQVLLHPVTGALYLFSVTDKSKGNSAWDEYRRKRIVKYDGIGTWKEMAAIELPARRRHMHDPGPLMTLDASGESPRLWVSCVGGSDPRDDCADMEGDYLWCVEDRGATLARVATPMPRHRWPFGPNSEGALALDRKRDELYFGGRTVDGSATVWRYEGRTGNLSEVAPIGREIARLRAVSGGALRDNDDTVRLPSDHVQITAMAFGADDRLYVRLMGPWSGMQNWIRRYDRDGRRIAFEAGDTIAVTQPSHGYKLSGFTVAPSGDIYVLELAPGVSHRTREEHNVVNVYGSDGRLKQAGVVPWLTSAAQGPRLDAQGRLHFTEALAPKALRPVVKTIGTGGAMMRGSLVRFQPRAARVIFGEAAGAETPYVLREREGAYPPARLERGELLYYGVSPVPFGHCVCPSASFDLDRFARAYLPDRQNYCVHIVDAAGNRLTSFGGYGNRDERGRGQTPAPCATAPLRSPDVIAAGDDAVYVLDGPNQRVIRLRLTYDKMAQAPAPWMPRVGDR